MENVTTYLGSEIFLDSYGVLTFGALGLCRVHARSLSRIHLIDMCHVSVYVNKAVSRSYLLGWATKNEKKQQPNKNTNFNRRCTKYLIPKFHSNVVYLLILEYLLRVIKQFFSHEVLQIMK